MTRSKARPSSKEYRRLFDQIREAGLELVHAQSGHWKVLKDGAYLLTISCTGGHYACAQVRRDLRRYHGIELS